MGHANGRIFRPGVDPSDVAVVLGENSFDYGTLCGSAKINMWARFKPEAQGDFRTLTIEARRNNNFGLSPTQTYMGKNNFIAAVLADTFTGGWTYKRVETPIYDANMNKIGGGNDFARIDDFTSEQEGFGYNVNAEPPFGKVIPVNIILMDNLTSTVVIPCEAPQSDPESIDISEFQKPGADYKNWYFGILLLHPTNASARFMATDVEPIGTSQNWQIDFGHINTAYAGTYRAVPFLSSKIFINGVRTHHLWRLSV